jgi:hypothetical protein
VAADREIRMLDEKAFQIPGMQAIDNRNFELEFYSLDSFIRLGRSLERLFL